MAMIKRIKEIKNIGVFSDSTGGGSIGFEKLTFLYGLNTYGKTTLTDIFQSIKNNDSGIIASRKTIPGNSESQKVVLSATEDGGSERELSFQNGSWTNNSVSQCIEIFGTDFIHKNIFTGLNIERGNKENFTQFILGEQGVSLAQQIKEKKQELGNQKKDLKNKAPGFVKGKSEKEIKEFLELSIDGLIKPDLEARLLEEKNSLNNEKERLKEPSKILNMAEPKKLEIPKNNILEMFNSLNDLLAEDYSNIKEASIAKLNQHLSSNFSENDGAETWIKHGLCYCKDNAAGNCPFCGQSLEGVRNLIELYNSYFDEEYNSFINRITNELQQKITSNKSIRFNSKSILQSTLSTIDQYNLLISNSDFNSSREALDQIIKSLDEDRLHSEQDKLVKEIGLKISEKIKSPYKRISGVSFESFKTQIKECYDALTKSPYVSIVVAPNTNPQGGKRSNKKCDNYH